MTGATIQAGTEQFTVHPLRLPISTAFLLAGTDGLAMIDTGLPKMEGRIWQQVQELGYRPEDLHLIVLTHSHPDHAGCLKALLRESGAKLAAHPLLEQLRGQPVTLPPAHRPWGKFMGTAYKPILPFLKHPDVAVDCPLEDGASLAELGLPATALHTPGHTRDSLCLLFEDGTAFTGDLLIPVRGRFEPQPYFIEDEAALQASVERLQAHQPLLVYSSHWPEPQEPPWLESSPNPDKTA